MFEVHVLEKYLASKSFKIPAVRKKKIYLSSNNA